LGSADHFLISRLYDFEQLPFHKAVVAFEEALKLTLAELARLKLLRLDRTSVEESISSGRWRRFDDQVALAQIREFHDAATGDKNFEHVMPFVSALLDRKAPKLVHGVEYMERLTKETDAEFEKLKAEVELAGLNACDEMGIDRRLAFTW